MQREWKSVGHAQVVSNKMATPLKSTVLVSYPVNVDLMLVSVRAWL